MNHNYSQNISAWANGRTGRFIIVQAVHTLITIAVIATLFFGAARVGALSGLLTPAAAPASSLTTINYQGRLADASGTPINNTNPGLGMTFALYTQQSGGTAVWSETQANVPVANGLFSVRLGSVNALSANLLSGDLWLGIQVGTDPEMTPREKLAAVPYAMQASVALTVLDGSISTSKLTDGAVTLSKLGEQPYYFTGALATPTEWMADVVFNGNYARFCQAIGRTFSRVDELQSHYTDWPETGIGQGNGYFYNGWYYVGTRVDSGDAHVYGNGNPSDFYNVWKYNGGAGFAVTRAVWTFERSAIIWCKP